MAQDSPYYIRTAKEDQSFGGFNQNFRDLSDRIAGETNFIDQTVATDVPYSITCSSGVSFTGATVVNGLVRGATCSGGSVSNFSILNGTQTFSGTNTFTNDIAQSSAALVANTNPKTQNALSAFCMVGTTVTITNVSAAQLHFTVMGVMEQDSSGKLCQATINLDGSLTVDKFTSSLPMTYYTSASGGDSTPLHIDYTTQSRYTGSHTACLAFGASGGAGSICTIKSGEAPLYIQMEEAHR